MVLGVGVQSPMTSSKCKQNMHKHIIQTSIKKLASKSKIIFIHCKLQHFPHL